MPAKLSADERALKNHQVAWGIVEASLRGHYFKGTKITDRMVKTAWEIIDRCRELQKVQPVSSIEDLLKE